MAMNKISNDQKDISYTGTLKEIKDIMGQLDFKYLYSLLGCARGLMKAQEAERSAQDD